MAEQKQSKQFNIRKKIASAGSNSIIVIPKILQDELKRGTIVDIQINIVEKAKESSEEFDEGIEFKKWAENKIKDLDKEQRK